MKSVKNLIGITKKQLTSTEIQTDSGFVE